MPQANIIYIDAQQLLEDSYRLGAQIINSGFAPTFMLAIWRGGVPIGVAVQEFLAYHHIKTDHIAIRTSSYAGIDQQARHVAVYGLDYLIDKISCDDKLLIIDDVFDTGNSLAAVIEHIKTSCRANAPQQIRIGVPYYKPARRKVDFAPDYYLHQTSQWLKFPHSLEGLSPAQIKAHRPNLYAIIKDCLI